MLHRRKRHPASRPRLFVQQFEPKGLAVQLEPVHRQHCEHAVQRLNLIRFHRVLAPNAKLRAAPTGAPLDLDALFAWSNTHGLASITQANRELIAFLESVSR